MVNPRLNSSCRRLLSSFAVLAIFLSCGLSKAADISPTNSLTLFGPRPIFAAGGATRVVVDDFGWIDYTVTPQQRWVISNSIAGWAQEGVAYAAYYANGQVESSAKDDPALQSVAAAIDLDGSPGNSMVFTRQGFVDYLIESGKLAIDLGATYLLLDNAAPDLATLSFDDESIAGFRSYLGTNFTTGELSSLGVGDVNSFDYRTHLLDAGYTDIASLQNNPPNDELWKAWTEHNRRLERRFFEQWTATLREYGQTNYGRAIYFGANRYITARQWDNIDLLDFGIAETFLDTLGYPNRDLIPTDKTMRNFGKRFWSWNFPANTTTLNGNASVWDPPKFTESDKIFVAETWAAGGLVQDPLGWVAFHNYQRYADPMLAFYQFPTKQPALFNHPEDGQFAVLYSEAGEINAEWETTPSFQGAVKLLVDLHWPFDVVFAGHPARRDGNDLLTLAQLQKYDAVVLPNTRYLTDQQVAILEQYVNDGGTIIGFGAVADRDENGNDVSGARTFADQFADDYVKDMGTGWIIPFTSNAAEQYYNNAADESLKSTLRATVLGKVSTYVNPEVAITHNNPADTYETELPYVFINRFQTDDGSKLLHIVNRRIDIPSGDVANQTITPLADAHLSVVLPIGYSVGDVQVSFVDAENPTPQTLTFTESGGRLEFDLPTFNVWSVVKIGSAAGAPETFASTPSSEPDLIGGHGSQTADATGGHRPDETDADGHLNFNYWYWKGGNHGAVPWNIPYFATDDTGLKQVDLFYRYSNDDVSWGDWQAAGSQAVSGKVVYGEFSFGAPDGEGYYQFYTQATDQDDLSEPVLPWAETGYGVDETPPGSPTDVVANNGIKSGYWTTDLTGLQFSWTTATDNLSGLGGSQVSLNDEIGTPHSLENIGTNTVWAPDTSGLTSSQKFKLYVRAEDAAGVWNSGAEVFDLFYGTSPVADVVDPAVLEGNGQLTVYWTKPADPNYFAAVVHFREANDPAAVWHVTSMTPDANTTYLTIPGLANDTPYQVRVVAFASGNQNGNYVLLPGTYTPSTANGNLIRLFVSHPTAGTLSYLFDPQNTVLQLKQQIETDTGTPAAQQQLLYKGLQMNDGNTLASYNVKFGDTLQLNIDNGGGGGTPFNITITQAGQPGLNLSVLATDTVLDLKSRIQSQRGVLVGDQHLFKGPTELMDNNQTLGFYGVQPNDQLTLEVQSPGPTFANWQQTQFPGGGANTGPADDWDGDGLANFVEYAYGTNPKAIDDASRLPHASVTSNGKLRIQYTRLKGATDFNWGMNQRPDFANPWSPVNPADFVTVQVTDRGDGTEDVTWEYQPSLNGSGFYEVIVIQNP